MPAGPRTKAEEVEAAWKQATEQMKPPPMSVAINQIRPFRAGLPDWLRIRLKQGVNDQKKPLQERVACAEKLGWLVDQESPTCFSVTTHNGQKFFIEEASAVVKGR